MSNLIKKKFSSTYDDSRYFTETGLFNLTIQLNYLHFIII